MKSRIHFFNHNQALLVATLALFIIIAIVYTRAFRSDLPAPVWNMQVSSIDSCELSLANHKGESPLDIDIARYQKLSQGTYNSNVYLERLGWAYISKARSSFDPGYFKLAQQTGLCLQHRDPNDLQAQLLLGHVLHQLHLFKQSESIARVLVERRGLWLDFALLGDVLMEQGNLLEAEQAYQVMIDQRPGPQAYLRAAHMRWLRGDLAGSLELMELAVGAIGEKNSENAAWAWVRLADYVRQAKRARLAESYIERALALQPDYPPALFLRGEILMSRGQYKQATKVLSQAVELHPSPLYQWSYLESLSQTGDEKLVAQIEQRLMQQGANLDRRSFALYLASRKQNAPLALALARQELEVRQDVFTLDSMAWALRANGQMTQAWKFVNRALAEGTNDARLFYHAGVIAEETGLSESAVDYYHRALDMNHLLLPSERQDMELRITAVSLRKGDLVRSLTQANHTLTTTGEI